MSEANKVEGSELSREELSSTVHSGVHRVVETMTGYKRLQCICDSSVDKFYWRLFPHSRATILTDVVAQIEVPVGSTIAKSEAVDYGDCGYPSSDPRLRADKAIVKKVEPIPADRRDYYRMLENCICFANNSTERIVEGHNITPAKPLSSNPYLNHDYNGGIDFFLSKDEAASNR